MHDVQQALKAERYAVNLAVTYRELSGAAVQAKVSDLSATGFQLRSAGGLRPGTEMWVRIQGLESRQARVVWSKDEQAGCAFDYPLHIAIVDHLVRESLYVPGAMTG